MLLAFDDPCFGPNLRSVSCEQYRRLIVNRVERDCLHFRTISGKVTAIGESG